MFFFKGVMEATSYSHLKIRQKRSGEKTKTNKNKQTCTQEQQHRKKEIHRA